MFDIESKRFTPAMLEEFSAALEQMSRQIGFKVSARGWCYLMESSRFINKDQFDRCEALINRCRKEGYLAVDFVAEEDARSFSGVEEKSDKTIKETLQWMLRDVLEGERYYTPDWWNGEDYYIQMLVEKIDLKTLFEPVCREYHIPVANAKGWSSILQRAEYARRFKAAEAQGLQCVLLYCGDHDPDGLRISDAIRQNLVQIQDIQWDDGTDGYDPRNLIIERFGLNFDFIESNSYTWIDNLITGSGKNLADPNHRNYNMPYLQQYLGEIGERKCEANAVVTTPQAARDLCRETIEGYVGDEAIARFHKKRERIKEKYDTYLDRYGLTENIFNVLNDTDDMDDDGDDEI